MAGDFTAHLVFQESLTGMPFGSVWDYYCFQQAVPVDTVFMDNIRGYEAQVLVSR